MHKKILLLFCIFLPWALAAQEEIRTAPGDTVMRKVRKIERKEFFTTKPQVYLENIGLEGKTIFMKLSARADSIRVNGQDHATLALACNTDSLAYTFRPEDPFARMTAFFPDGAVIYSNPFARYDAASAPDPFNNAPQRVNWVLTILYNLLALAVTGLLLRAIVKLFRKR